MGKKLFFKSIFILLLFPLGVKATICEEWNRIQAGIYSGQITNPNAMEIIVSLHSELINEYKNKIQSHAKVFPLKNYSSKDIGGINGSGFKPLKYNFYDGNRHKGHPAHDIFVKDQNRDFLDDLSEKPVEVVSFTEGVVVGVNKSWSVKSDLRGGISLWVFSPQNETYYYYAHLSKLYVKPGGIVRAGDKIAHLGRTGKNAFKKRSPTHLHFMALKFDQGKMTPHNTYEELHSAKLLSEKAQLIYSWLNTDTKVLRRVVDIKTPQGYSRSKATVGSFRHWLRNLPLKPKAEKVYLHNKKLKGNQSAHYAVIDIDTPAGDLQQCADAAMRLRSEYLYSVGKYDAISFNFANGFAAPYSKWLQGYRISVAGNDSRWISSHVLRRDDSYQNFKRYLRVVFSYANTYSLARQMKRVTNISNIKIGDVFIRGGFPGHAVIVLDVAQNADGDKIFIAAQSFMPAQDMHILKSYDEISPWYKVSPKIKIIKTPEYVFRADELRRF